MAEKRDSRNLEADTEPQLLNGINYTGNKGPCFGARYSIIIILALGSSLSFTTKSAFSVIIVAMTNSSTSSNANIPTYDWNNKGMILSSVMWLGIPVQLIAGHWGKQYGHKYLIMGSVAVNAIFFMLIPPMAKIGGSIGVLVCRLISGAANGILSPVSVGVSGLWVPAQERSKAGMIGIGMTFIVAMATLVASGQIAASSWGYPACCYIIGALNLLWCVAWYFLGHQSPATHPRITPEEREYIETSLSSNKTKNNIPTPWLKLLTSIHFWAPVVAAIGTSWIDTIMSTTTMIFMNQVWDVDVAKGTTTTAIAPIIGMSVGIFLAPLSDFLIKRNYLRVVNARRIFQTVGITGNSLVLLWMTWIPPKSMTLIVANMCIGNICTIAFSVGGAGLNILDISPTFAGIISGFSSTLGQCFALFAPMTIDWFLTDESDPNQWRPIFYLTGAIATGSAIFFDIFSTDKRQWDTEEEENSNNNNNNINITY